MSRHNIIVRLIDTHCHLYDDRAFPDPAMSIEEAAESGVDRLILIGIDSATSRLACAMADRWPGLYFAAGWHPTHSFEYSPEEIHVIRDLMSHPKAVAVGEIGFDFYWDKSTPQEQEVCLRDHMDLALELGKPVVFHCREAYPTLLTWLESEPALPSTLFHCFAGNSAEAERALALGSFFGVDGPLTYPKNEELRSIFSALPRDRVVVETDAPYLAPVPFRGKPSSPAMVKHTNARLAQVWDISESECAALTTSNAERFFGIS